MGSCTTSKHQVPCIHQKICYIRICTVGSPTYSWQGGAGKAPSKKSAALAAYGFVTLKDFLCCVRKNLGEQGMQKVKKGPGIRCAVLERRKKDDLHT